MDAFEQLVSETFWREGYWTQTSVKVDLTKEEKVEIGRHSAPRWEIDVVAYSGSRNEILALECKSFLDSRGVAYPEFLEGHSSTRYKLFREPVLRKVVMHRLMADLRAKGYINANSTIKLGLVAGKIRPGDSKLLSDHFIMNGWALFDPEWLKTKTTALASSRYSNDVAAVVSKVLLR